MSKSSVLGVCSLNKRERVWAAGDLFSRLTHREPLRRSEPSTSFILAAWVVKLRGCSNTGLPGLYLWESLCNCLTCGRSSVCFFAGLLESSERFVRLKDVAELLLALRLTNLVLGKVQWVFYGRKIVFVVKKSGLFALQKTWGDKKLVAGLCLSFCCPWGELSRFQLSSFEPLSVFVPHYLAASLASREPDTATAKSQKCSGCLSPCGSDFPKWSGLHLPREDHLIEDSVTAALQLGTGHPLPVLRESEEICSGLKWLNLSQVTLSCFSDALVSGSSLVHWLPPGAISSSKCISDLPSFVLWHCVSAYCSSYFTLCS